MVPPLGTSPYGSAQTNSNVPEIDVIPIFRQLTHATHTHGLQSCQIKFCYLLKQTPMASRLHSVLHLKMSQSAIESFRLSNTVHCLENAIANPRASMPLSGKPPLGRFKIGPESSHNYSTSFTTQHWKILQFQMFPYQVLTIDAFLESLLQVQ